MRQCSVRAGSMSSAYTARPVTLATASTLGSGLPTTENSATDALRSQHDRVEDLGVPGAAAEVSGEGLTDLVARRFRVAFEQRLRGQQDARRAVAALCRAQLGEGLLEGVQLGPVGHALDRGHGAPFQLHRQEQAAELGLAVDQDGAGSALAQLASVLGARELHVLAQHLEQRLVNGKQELGLFAVHVESQHDPLDVACHLLLHWLSSISFNAPAHAQRSGATASARLATGGGSSGWTRIVRMPSVRAGSMSFSSRLPIATQRSAGTPAQRSAIWNTAGCGFRCPASTDVTMASMCCARPSRRKSSQ